ncbi:apolipoprotein N-acyltransferase [Amycolatopsis decaplanina]|uniref:Nitrilase/cyanide hydratase and apolipoprotein N-acyltransferase n=1 Tax=Amycolatopsis decaplanina DSM 44594 TaxID=1284240 RepID=M2XU79_9PSEU|nr:nitrilase-related carbon-nitrogen hydrolase [Amycolatopsis decaplanina]EME52765.1 nitrilase/cyanide hydratase and apolipoprotein N-acyltransferase [Amycolatopsis decaplanina DSM 44594]
MKPRLLWWLGTALLLLAVHTDWNVPLAAWVFPVFLLRYARQVPLRRAILIVGLSLLIGQLFWLGVTGLLFVLSGLLAFTLLTVLQTTAFLADRLLADRAGPVRTLVFPVTLVAGEYLFTVITGFGDFGALGSTQSTNLPLLQTASVTGVYGVTFVLAWFASVANTVWTEGWPRVRRTALVHACVLGVVFAAGGARLLFDAPTTETVRIAGISPSSDADRSSSDALERIGVKYWRAEEVGAADPVAVGKAFAPVTEDLVIRTRQQASAGAKIVLWPETHARVLERDQAALLARVGAEAKQAGIHVGLAYALYTAQAPYIRNVAVLVGPTGEVAWTYDKTHPTPMEPMTPGPGTVHTTDSPYGRLAAVICYDADFPGLMRQAAGKETSLMLVPANDWPGFGSLHAEKASFRAVENGYSLFRHSTHGNSTAVDSQGRVLGHADFHRTDQQTLVADLPVQPRTQTVYGRVGDVFAWLCLAAATLCPLWTYRRRRTGKR